MTRQSEGPPGPSLVALGWSDFFADQILPEEASALPVRIAAVHRSRITAISPIGPVRLVLAARTNTGDFAVGDWGLADPQSLLLQRRLARKTVLQRRTEGNPTPQLAGANIDTLFIVTSCNAEFDVARLERYLALANEAGITPVIVLTKADLTEDAGSYHAQAAALQRGLAVVVSNPKTGDATRDLQPWCGEGQTVAMVGSSGVGKSTMVNALAGAAPDQLQETGSIREHDAQGRHTTTSRSLHAMAGGGWVIDTPGMRTLHVSDAAAGIDELFAEITELAPLCKFRDCTHAHEPGCAVRAAVSDGRLEPERLARWRTMVADNRNNTPKPVKPGGGRPAPRRRPPTEAD
ncbi:MAG: GTPase RsgA [Tardiphaga sp.]|uniref:ribosome small subunit-dependent GTPase A n=1 Tax=Tardiphaga sp. TaxID=1926292 RepID=UPI002634E0B2|nr:ribosome small subunit-dependent GTPase A [Tardiphaga sp.]MDB5503889.1 GTPase RsgA [Tardiphaga sp.]